MRPKYFLSLAVILTGLPALSQTRFTAADYARAEKFMTYNTTPLVYNGGVRPSWISGDRFYYRNTTAQGTEFILVDPAKGTRQPAFDHVKVAAALSSVAGGGVNAYRLPFQEIDVTSDGQTVSFNYSGRHYECDTQGSKCADRGVATASTGGGGGRGGRGGRGGGATGGRNESLSPDKKRAVFIRDYNLWMRDAASNKETQLTTDGIKDFGYATDNAGWSTSDRAIVSWSPDSRKVATFQQDQRGVGEMYLVETKVGHPTLRSWKYPLPGDHTVTMIQRVVIDLDAAKVIRLQMPPDQHRSTLCDDLACGGDWGDVQWAPDGSHLAFVSTSRDHKIEQLKVADTATGAVREVMEEKVATFFESGNGRVDWHYLPASNEFIWFSEKDNWGHLYLHDLNTGKLKNQITTGEGNVTRILRVDEQNRLIYFLGVGREKGRDPYFAYLYKVGFDGKNAALLTPEDGNHDVTLSPDGAYFVDSYSKPDVPPVALVRDRNGKLIANLEKADISKLLATGWKAPVPFSVKARDGVTDIYGLMFKPSNLDLNKKYPIINHIYPGPQTGSVGSRSFSAARGDCDALAELGFIVVEIDGMGTPWRSKKFHEAYYGDMGDNTLPDQVAAMRQLAAKYPYIDLERTGIYGHSGGGYATADAMFRYPDFFKVGISESGNHDNREYEDDWGEKWQGLLQDKPGSAGDNYDSQANQLLAKNLKGHLLLAHGTMDNNVPPYNTLLVVNELIKANKDFDLIMFPNAAHGYGAAANYMTRRRWDYFIRYLYNAEPPANYQLSAPAQGGRGGQ
ncbi:MAG TPA: DPP IV N-terminal domain-containing protein [Candidatus Sulfopaludibacter sp.]|jgi:dipeptidyl aminopeptidase/acylaminoacyl peptidase|nr:DPP IV N-terminal domain-containing protein [Candidatus Sulfopaludibacter sp.]